ncbi:unnamed protein product [Protopolystoma xenopodis]|uniref:Methyltransferase domain-containing protein n=1 Tax=Protopolystoma xenopodis TaxID=117903 RepID=A0A3S5CLU8_9PLAT|nr:unnamed protein product [Protopolystoma xenopodis]
MLAYLDIETLLPNGICASLPGNSSVQNEKESLLSLVSELKCQLAACKRFLNELITEPLPLCQNCSGSPTPVSASDRDAEKQLSYPINNSFGDDESYFLSYSHYGIHAEMLSKDLISSVVYLFASELKAMSSQCLFIFNAFAKFIVYHFWLGDDVRSGSYRTFIINNADSLFKGKRVLDVGAGTGILSLFATQASAEHVFAVEASAEMFAATCETILENKLEDLITVIHDRAELAQLPVSKVDVVISEWMGHFLLHESMLESVIQIANR